MSESTETVLACVNFTNEFLPSSNICIAPWKDGRFCQLVFDRNGAASLEWYQSSFAEEFSVAELVEMTEPPETAAD